MSTSVTYPCAVSTTLLAGSLAPAARTLVDLLIEVATEHPEAPALDDGRTVLSYTELLSAVRAMAVRLARTGVGPGSSVGVRVPSGSVDLYLSILGTLMIGAAYVPVDVDDPDERARTVFGEAGVDAVITAGDPEASAPSPQDLPGHAARVRIAAADGSELPAVALSRDELRAPEPTDDAWIIFTSGSTGTPKGVAVTHRNAAAFVDAEARMFLQDDPLGPGDRVLAGLSVAFDASCEEMWLAWGHGACLVPAPRALVKSGTDLGPWLSSRRISVVSTVPTLAALWPQASLSGVRLLIFGGEACPPELAARLSDGTREVWNTYGPTEATVVACGALLDGSDPVRIGLPLDGWDLAVVNQETGQPVAEGEVGELVIGGVGLARYLDAAKDAEKYAPHPELGWERAYRSGDLVVNDPAGLIFQGRADEQVKLGGRRIELGEVDAALASLPGVNGGAAAVKDTAAGSQLLVGYLVPATGTEADTAGWTERLREVLPAALVPRLAIVDDLPTKTSGKVDRKALPWPLPGATGAGESTGEGASGAEDLSEAAAWVAGVWESVLGGAPGVDTDFFDAGGGSLAAARLVSLLRERHPAITVGDVYARPRFGALAEMLTGEDAVAAQPAATPRDVAEVPVGFRFAQTFAGLPLLLFPAVRWAVPALVVGRVAHEFGAPVPAFAWWLIGALWLLFVSPWGRMLLAAGLTRVAMRGIRPGVYRRGGSVHLRLWWAEHVQALAAPVSPGSAPWVTWYARLLGNRIGPDTDLHSVPPVTGLLTLGEGAAVEPEVDLSGWWIDGDEVHIGTVEIREHASVGARSTMLPNSKVGPGAVVEAGSAVSGAVKKNRRYSGSPAVRVGKARGDWPDPLDRRPRSPFLLYVLGALGHSLIPFAAAVPALALVVRIEGWDVITRPLALLAWTPAAALLWFFVCALLIVASVRILGIGIKEGVFPVRSGMAYRVWATERLMDVARDLLFPLYAGMITPWWLRLLGTEVGRDVEASTVVLVPSMTKIADGAFLADDTLIGSYEMGHGWMRIGRAKVGKRAFVGNSGMTAPGRKVPKNALVAVLSATPPKSRKGSSWIGSPPVEMRRNEVEAESALTYEPPVHLKVVRALWETLRLSSVVVAGLLVFGVAWGLLWLSQTFGLAGVVLGGPLVLMAAGFLAAGTAVVTKWLFSGRIGTDDHPLWSSFVWRTEVADCFVELIAAPWFARPAAGTPALVWYLRAMGSKLGHGVWCESYWLPEADLVHLEDGSTVNRGCVVQTHLFHDRVMSLDHVRLGVGSTLGPNSVILPGAELGEGATVGPVSLVMRGEVLPVASRFMGNPVQPWADKD
ncbi:Pls/PosA family non-ribosomal peptide synthetase [Brevibacterium litoralis]|uniref:Pls/PosA family non-ribosomal peptide synthetase n=1 Tax=Brevibacterium litoralis TaxID=3138935 RepID=UPI003D9AB504